MAKLLDQALVTRYAKYRALKNLLDKWLEDKRGALLHALARGARCPDRGPFLIELTKVEDRANWKEEFRIYLIANGQSEEEATKLLEAIADKERPKVARLECKRNPNYRRAYPIRLPA